MDQNKLIFNTIDLNMIELIQDEQEYTDEAFSSISLNPLVSWIKFILTDDQPNANKQRVPLEEFSNLIKTGIFMPIKMASGEIKDGHENSLPLGVITHLKEDGNQIRGIAALWNRERPEDIDLIKNLFKDGKKPQLSWEIAYSAIEELDGIQILKDTALKAATFVGMPAYAGRTPVIAVANKQENQEDTALEEIEKLQSRVSELEAQLAEKDTAVAEKETELASLREFKAGVEEDKQKEEKLASIKAKFAEAGITKEEEYFDTNKETLLGLDEAAIDFMIQELVAFSSQTAEASEKKTKEIKVPRVVSDVKDSLDPKDLATALRERNAKK